MIAKLDTEMFHRESCNLVYFEGQKVKGQGVHTGRNITD